METKPNLDQQPATKGEPDTCLTMTIVEAAKVLGISRGSAYTLAGNGELPTIRLGRRMLVPKHELQKLVGLA